MQATEPVPRLIGPPWEPGKQESQSVKGSAIKNGETPARAAGNTRVVLQVPKQGVIECIPDHVNYLERKRAPENIDKYLHNTKLHN